MTWYTVYKANDDAVAACGDAKDCAKALGITLSSFRCMICRSRKGLTKRYTVLVEELDTDGETIRDYTLKAGAPTPRRGAGFDRGMFRRHYDEGLNDYEISAATGAAQTTVWNWRTKEGLPANGIRGGGRREKEETV